MAKKLKVAKAKKQEELVRKYKELRRELKVKGEMRHFENCRVIHLHHD